ncbi:MAG: transposase [Peptococcaceae bacterium]|nr:transposase [Peptococcaceae bacterium]
MNKTKRTRDGALVLFCSYLTEGLGRFGYKALKEGIEIDNQYICAELLQIIRPKNLTIGGSFFMAKYSFEFKMQVGNDYLEGNGGYHCLDQKYGISQYSAVLNWVNAITF